MDNYIDFYYDENDNFIADIFFNGKLKRVRNPKNMDKLISIAEKYNYIVDDEGRIRKRATSIINEFGKYMLEKKKKKRKISIYNNISKNMKLSRKNPAIGKKIGAGLLALTIAATGIGLNKAHSKENNSEPIAYTDQIQDDNTSHDSIETTTDNKEIDDMMQHDSFHFSYENRSKSQSVKNAREYQDLFEKYGKMYGVDPSILIAIAAQESSGDHYNNLGDNAPACGIMQIEKSVHIGETIAAYNFETGNIDQILITEQKLKDVETNIQIGTIFFKDCLKASNYNIPLAIQTYNFGYGNIDKVLQHCSNLENISIDDIKNNPTNNSWLKHRDVIDVGDPQYVEHVLSYLDANELKVTTRDGDQVTINIQNDYQKNFQYN